MEVVQRLHLEAAEPTQRASKVKMGVGSGRWEGFPESLNPTVTDLKGEALVKPSLSLHFKTALAL